MMVHLKLYQVGAHCEWVAMDILVLFPPNGQGRKYILVIVDYFMKLSGAFSLPSHEANVAAKAFVEGFLSRHGIPE